MMFSHRTEPGTAPGTVLTRRKVLAAGLVASGCLLSPGCAKVESTGASEGTLERIKQMGTFNLGVNETMPPYGYLDAADHFAGFSTEIARKVHERLEQELQTPIKLNCVPVTSRTRIALLQNRTIDMEAGATVITRGRHNAVDFSIPFFLTTTCALVPAESPVASVRDLEGRRLGAPRGGLEEVLFTKRLLETAVFRGPVKYIGFEGHPEGLTALQAGAIEAYCTDGPILHGLRMAAPDPARWRVFDLDVNLSAQAFPLRQNNSRFTRIVNLTIVDLFANGLWQLLYEKYFVPLGYRKELPEPLALLRKMNNWPE